MPAELPHDYGYDKEGVVAGWGDIYTADGKQTSPTILQYLSVTSMGPDECKKQFNVKFKTDKDDESSDSDYPLDIVSDDDEPSGREREDAMCGHTNKNVHSGICDVRMYNNVRDVPDRATYQKFSRCYSGI